MPLVFIELMYSPPKPFISVTGTNYILSGLRSTSITELPAYFHIKF